MDYLDNKEVSNYVPSFLHSTSLLFIFYFLLFMSVMKDGVISMPKGLILQKLTYNNNNFVSFVLKIFFALPYLEMFGRLQAEDNTFL